jgi:hypothetical protein
MEADCQECAVGFTVCMDGCVVRDDRLEREREITRLRRPAQNELANSTSQPAPTSNTHPAVWDLVVADMKDRDKLGEQKYGVRLQPHNGRKSLVDLYQELLDAVAYIRQEIYERSGK